MLEEEKFANEIIIPLLFNMGFIDIRNNHGIEEFGKDVLFAKFDAFGIKRHYAAQVKAKDINGRNKGDMEDVISHINRAFNVSFPDIVTKEYVYIDEFFVITKGNYIGNALEQLARDKRIEQYGNRLHFFDRNKVRELSKYNLALYKEKIDGIILELMYNKGILQKILDNIEAFKRDKRVPLSLLKLHNMEIYLESLKEQDSEIIPDMIILYRNLQNINAILERFRLGLALIEDQEGYIKTSFPDAIAGTDSLIAKLFSLMKRI